VSELGEALLKIGAFGIVVIDISSDGTE